MAESVKQEVGVYDVVIVGSGPSGLTAGLYTSRAGLNTLIVGGVKWGGQLMLTTEVENFPGFPEGIQGPELMERMRKQCERFGVKVVEEDVKNVDFSEQPYSLVTESGRYRGRSVIVATGAAYQWLGLPSEERLIGRGVSSCAPCDAPFFRNKRVVVVGGGDAAMEEALVLTKFASEVYVVHRRGEFRASKIMQERVLAEKKIKVIWNTEVVEVLGEAKVEGVKLSTRVGAGGYIQSVGGKLVSEDGDGSVWEMAAEGVFVAIGHKPATEVFVGVLDVDAKGYLKRSKGRESEVEHGGGSGYRTMSNVEGVFVSGDVHDVSYRQAITAAGYGCMAAMEVERWLGEQGSGVLRVDRRTRIG